MSVPVALVVAWAVLAAISSVLLLHGTVTLVRRCPQLGELRPPEPPSWPALSVVVPACNEATTIEPALASLLAQDYPGLEIVLVNDRSTDGTRAIIERLAESDPKDLGGPRAAAVAYPRGHRPASNGLGRHAEPLSDPATARAGRPFVGSVGRDRGR